jgi:hypothetical protein
VDLSSTWVGISRPSNTVAKGAVIAPLEFFFLVLMAKVD